MSLKQLILRAIKINFFLAFVSIILFVIRQLTGYLSGSLFDGIFIGVIIFSFLISFFFTWHVIRLKSIKDMNPQGVKSMPWGQFYGTIIALPYRQVFKLMFIGKKDFKKIDLIIGQCLSKSSGKSM